MDEFLRPIATVDVVPLFLGADGLLVGIQRRDRAPHGGEAALVGGFVRPDEDGDVEATALRVLQVKAGLRPTHLEQLAVFSGPRRDPRGWSLSVAFVALARDTDGASLELVPLDALPSMPFDHGHIVEEALERVRSKAGYSSLPLRFLGETFTLPEAHEVYETVLGTTLDRAAFRRKILDSGFMEPTGETRAPSARAARPTALYRISGDGLLYTPRNFGPRG